MIKKYKRPVSAVLKKDAKEYWIKIRCWTTWWRYSVETCWWRISLSRWQKIGSEEPRLRSFESCAGAIFVLFLIMAIQNYSCSSVMSPCFNRLLSRSGNTVSRAMPSGEQERYWAWITHIMPISNSGLTSGSVCKWACTKFYFSEPRTMVSVENFELHQVSMKRLNQSGLASSLAGRPWIGIEIVAQ